MDRRPGRGFAATIVLLLADVALTATSPPEDRLIDAVEVIVTLTPEAPTVVVAATVRGSSRRLSGSRLVAAGGSATVTGHVLAGATRDLSGRVLGTPAFGGRSTSSWSARDPLT